MDDRIQTMSEANVDPVSESPDAARPRPSGLLSRLLGVLLSPAETFEAVVAAPRWLDMLALTAVVAAASVGAFLSSDVGRQAWLDEATSRIASSGREGGEAERQSLDAIAPYVGLLGGAQALVFAPLVSLVAAGILFAVFSTLLGATATFRELFAVVVHSGMIGAVQSAFTWTLNYFRESMSSPTTLAAFLPMLDEESFLFRLVRAIDLFLIWWIVVLAVGLGVLYRRKSRPIAAVLLGVYGLIALFIAVLEIGS